MKVIAPVLRDHASFVEVKSDSEKEYNENLHEKIATTIFNSSCGSVRKLTSYLLVPRLHISDIQLLAVFHRLQVSEELVHLPMELICHVVLHPLGSIG